MFSKFYDFIVPTFPDLRLCMTDTDSFLFSYSTSGNKPLEKMLKENEDHFDFSNLKPDGKYGQSLFCMNHKNELNRFKLESKDAKIVAACCLRSKLYALLYEDSKELLKMKGTPYSCFEKNDIMYQTYENCLNEIPVPKTEYYRIGAKSHEVSKFLQKKSTLVSPFDDKRYLLDCGRHSFPFGSIYATKKYSKNCPFCK